MKWNPTLTFLRSFGLLLQFIAENYDRHPQADIGIDQRVFEYLGLVNTTPC
jgi:hypothetical protein